MIRMLIIGYVFGRGSISPLLSLTGRPRRPRAKQRPPSKVYVFVKLIECLYSSRVSGARGPSRHVIKLAGVCFYGRNQEKSRHGADIALTMKPS